MVKLTIDGKEVEAEGGMTVMQACEQAGQPVRAVLILLMPASSQLFTAGIRTADRAGHGAVWPPIRGAEEREKDLHLGLARGWRGNWSFDPPQRGS